jgi:hypothetical protein
MVRFRATPLDLLVPTSVEVPVALQLRTGRASLDERRNVIPANPAVALHIAVSDVVADALITDRFEQPRRSISPSVSITRLSRVIPRTAHCATYPTVMQALSAANKYSCGLANRFVPPSSQGSSMSIENRRSTSSPPIPKPSTCVRLRVWLCQVVATRQFVLPFAASRLTHHLGVELAFGHAELRRPNLLCGTQSESAIPVPRGSTTTIRSRRLSVSRPSPTTPASAIAAPITRSVSTAIGPSG